MIIIVFQPPIFYKQSKRRQFCYKNEIFPFRHNSFSFFCSFPCFFKQKTPHIALLTNLLPNHLDRYGSFEKYCAAKESIFKYQKSSDRGRAVSFFNADDSIGALWCEKYGEEETRTCIKFRPDDVSEEFRGRFGLPGRAL